MKLRKFVEDYLEPDARIKLWEVQKNGACLSLHGENEDSPEFGTAQGILDGSCWQSAFGDWELRGARAPQPEFEIKGVVNVTLARPEAPVMTRPKPSREAILKNAMRCVCGGRDQDYGEPENSFGMIARLWSDYLGFEGITPKDVAIMMALLKIARIAGGDNPDSFVDLAGYAACAGELAAENRHD